MTASAIATLCSRAPIPRGSAGFRARTVATAGLAAAAFLLALRAAGAAPPDVAGTWLTAAGTSTIRIAPCGPARCGTIVWTKAPARDARNPDPALRSRDLVGVRIISDARPADLGWTGALYNPLEGRTYTGRMRLLDPDHLELSGCVLAGLICQAQTWTRVR